MQKVMPVCVSSRCRSAIPGSPPSPSRAVLVQRGCRLACKSWQMTFRNVYCAGSPRPSNRPPISTRNILPSIANDRKFKRWYNREGVPTDPADDSDPRFDFLASFTLHEYLTQRTRFPPAVADFPPRCAVDALAGTSEQVSVYTAIS